MATHALRDQLTLVELAKRTLDGQHLAVAEVLAETNEVLTDAVWIESNQPTSHITTKRVSLPSGTWRKVNSGVYREASTTKQIEEGIGMLEAYSVVDKFLVDIAPNPREFRSSEDLAFVEGLSQTLADILFRDASGTVPGDTTQYPERFNGFLPRWDDVSNNDNVRTPATTGDTANACTSIWIVQWAPTMVHMVYPKGSKMGLEIRDLGEQTVQTGLMTTGKDISTVSSGGTISEYQAYRTHFAMRSGLVVRDDRCVQRYCNIEDVTTGAGLFDEDDLIKAANALPYQGKNAVMYANQTMKNKLDIAAKDSGNLAVASITDVFGAPVTVFRGIPVRRVDAITMTESIVPA